MIVKTSLHRAFTLIELLIVVAIIAILAAIAVPNFLEAQTRSKVSRVKADMRSLATALEAYCSDASIYPPNDGWGSADSQYRLERFGFLTTPIAYITSYPRDPFVIGDKLFGTSIRSFQYFNMDYRYRTPPTPAEFVSWGWTVRAAAGAKDLRACCMKSWGPDAARSMSGAVLGDSGGEWAIYGLDKVFWGWPGINRLYDPTNGTISAGDIVRFVGGSAGVPSTPN
ncbi:MAG: prepilin-type N-terminal cleavage/methylation domain-containing protein [Candidatus Sumerlaeota bacterium]|nr:prepilin-type N-terminal cleavage/methylation domain-containing protein [Candidatus Sumerlaeota bacterium]